MHRRLLIGSALALWAAPAGAWGQAGSEPERRLPPLITPQNELERVFVAALSDESMRPEFRRLLLESPVVLAMANSAPDSPPLELVFGGLRTAALFTSAARQDRALGPASPRQAMYGRAALMLLRGRNIVLNIMHTPMLTLEPEDIAAYLGS